VGMVEMSLFDVSRRNVDCGSREDAGNSGKA